MKFDIKLANQRNRMKFVPEVQQNVLISLINFPFGNFKWKAVEHFHEMGDCDQR